MPAWIVAPSGLIEPVPAPVIYVKRIGAIQLIDRNTVCTHYISEELPYDGDTPHRIVAVKLMRSIDFIPADIGALAQVLTHGEPVLMPDHGPRLVK